MAANVKTLPTVPNRLMYRVIILALALGLLCAGTVFPLGMILFPCFPIYPLAVLLESQNRCDAPTVYETIICMCINSFHVMQVGGVGLVLCVVGFTSYLMPLWHLNFGRYIQFKKYFYAWPIPVIFPYSSVFLNKLLEYLNIFYQG